MSKAMKTLLLVFLVQMLPSNAADAAPSEDKTEDKSTKKILDEAVEIAQDSSNLLGEDTTLEDAAEGGDEDEEMAGEGDEENEQDEDDENEDEQDEQDEDEEGDDEDNEDREDDEQSSLLGEGANETDAAEEGADDNEEGEEEEGEQEEGENEDEDEGEDEEGDEDDNRAVNLLQSIDEKRHSAKQAAEEIDEFFKDFDTDKDEQMSWAEFMQVFEQHQKGENQEDSASTTEFQAPQGLEEAFNEADANQNKLLSKEEVEKFAELLEEKKVEL